MKLKDGREFWMESFTGEVVEDRQWTDTTIDSATSISGRTIRLSSKSTDKMQFWLRAADGTEKVVNLHDSGLQLRQGHVVTVVNGGVGKWGTLVLVFQHTTGQELNFLKTKGMDTFDAAGLDGKTSAVNSFLTIVLGCILLISLVGIPILILLAAISMYRTYRFRSKFMEQFTPLAQQFKDQGSIDSAALKTQKAAA